MFGSFFSSRYFAPCYWSGTMAAVVGRPIYLTWLVLPHDANWRSPEQE